MNFPMSLYNGESGKWLNYGSQFYDVRVLPLATISYVCRTLYTIIIRGLFLPIVPRKTGLEKQNDKRLSFDLVNFPLDCSQQRSNLQSISFGYRSELLCISLNED